MTTTLAPQAAAALAQPADAVVEATPHGLRVRPDRLVDLCRFLRDEPALSFDYLVMLTAVDYIEDDYFEVVYLLRSLGHNHELTLKVRTDNRDDPVVPSVIDVWQTAEFQEREVYDLLGVRFAGHPDLRRLFMWDEFRGYPLRKDFLPLSQ